MKKLQKGIFRTENCGIRKSEKKEGEKLGG
jgi:hypothetical protein